MTRKDELAFKFERFKLKEIQSNHQHALLGGSQTVSSTSTNNACTLGDEGCCDTDTRTETDRSIPPRVESEVIF